MFICQVCGKPFERAGARGRLPMYCSTACRTGGRKTELVRNCDVCGVQFVANAKGNPRRTCSEKCRQEKDNARSRVKRLHEKSCEICGTVFVTGRKASVACSPDCQRERIRRYQKIAWQQRLESRPETKSWICRWCGGEIVVPYSLTGNRVYHDECRAQATRAKNRKKSVKRQGAKTQETILHEVIAERDGFICHLCNEPVDMSLSRRSHFGATLDHVIPISKGGLDTEANVKLAHWICNVRKSDKLGAVDA